MSNTNWPELSLADWEPTYRTLHRYTQVVGKIRLRLCPPVNHWWHASLRFNAHGLTTTPMPHGNLHFEMSFDFVEHLFRIAVSDGSERTIALGEHSVAEFYAAVLRELSSLGIDVTIWPMPVEVPNPIPFTSDHQNATYEKRHVETMWTILSNVYGALSKFRSRFVGKSSPVHFFWGAFDVALTRFSGRPNPTPPADSVMREAYSHEVISHGFWFGGDWPAGGRVESPMFYAYALPEPSGFSEARVQPASASYAKSFGEFVLSYDDVRRLSHPEDAILAFCESTYEAGARLGNWPTGLVR